MDNILQISWFKNQSFPNEVTPSNSPHPKTMLCRYPEFMNLPVVKYIRDNIRWNLEHVIVHTTKHARHNRLKMWWISTSFGTLANMDVKGQLLDNIIIVYCHWAMCFNRRRQYFINMFIFDNAANNTWNLVYHLLYILEISMTAYGLELTIWNWMLTGLTISSRKDLRFENLLFLRILPLPICTLKHLENLCIQAHPLSMISSGHRFAAWVLVLWSLWKFWIFFKTFFNSLLIPLAPWSTCCVLQVRMCLCVVALLCVLRN